MKKKRIGLMLSVLVIISLIAVTIGVTYAFFNYAKEGTKDNYITTGTITFLYTEVSEVGRGISIKDAYPISDSQGKLLTGEGNVFDFKITSNTMDESSIPYEVTARKKSDSTLDEKAVKLYLTKVDGTSEEEVLLANYNSLTQTDYVLASKHTEKTIYNGKVPAGEEDYEQNFRLRMWIDSTIDFSPVKDENGNDTYPYNDKEFTVTVNVYANAKVVTDEDIANESKAEISSLSVDGTELTQVTGKDYNYETTLPEGTTSTTINIETISEYATVSIERLDSLAYETSNIKRLSTSRTLELNSGNNYFKITVISEDKDVESEYKLKINVEKKVVLEGFAKIIYDNNELIESEPTLTDSSNNTSDVSGLYVSYETNDGNPTYYFRGNVENNYIDFAGFTWRVVRINEDGTIRLIMQDGINDNKRYVFNSVKASKDNMYYSNSDTAKTTLDAWYNEKIASNTNYSNKVESGNYFCEEAKVAYNSSYASNSGTDMKVYNDGYTPDFTCEKNGKDNNEKGLLNASVGLLNYDEVVHAGGYHSKGNDSYYLYNNSINWWTMSPAGFFESTAYVWDVVNTGRLNNFYLTNKYCLRPVINLKADVTVTGTGASDDHWIVQ